MPAGCKTCLLTHSQVNRSGISNLTGLAGAANIQGEDQKKLDVVSNTVFCNALRASGRTVGRAVQQGCWTGSGIT